MLNFIKKNKYFIIILMVVVLLLFIDSVIYLQEYNEQVKMVEKYIDNGYELAIPFKIDVLTKLNDYFFNGFTVVVQFIFPLFLIIIGVYPFHQKLHSGFFKDVIIRKKYSRYMLDEFISSFKAIALIPIIVVMGFIFALFVCDFSFVNVNSFYEMSAEQNYFQPTNGELIVSIISRTFNLMIVSVFCVNIGLIISKKNSNFILVSVFSYLFIVIYQVFVAIFLGPLLTNLFNNNFFANGLTLFNFWFYDSEVTSDRMFLYALLLVVISGSVLFNTYKNKEEVIKNVEA